MPQWTLAIAQAFPQRHNMTGSIAHNATHTTVPRLRYYRLFPFRAELHSVSDH